MSGGMLRRVGIAQAIVNDPDLLLDARYPQPVAFEMTAVWARTCCLRSSSVRPPQMPCACQVRSANARHWRRTGQRERAAFA
jgi:hypothetical protein